MERPEDLLHHGRHVDGVRCNEHGTGFWQSEYRGTKNPSYSNDEKLCFLSTIRVLSGVFDEARPLTTLDQGATVLYLKRNAPVQDIFDAHLLTLWLNVANGSIDLADPADSDGNGTFDTTVGWTAVSPKPPTGGWEAVAPAATSPCLGRHCEAGRTIPSRRLRR